MRRYCTDLQLARPFSSLPRLLTQSRPHPPFPSLRIFHFAHARLSSSRASTIGARTERRSPCPVLELPPPTTVTKWHSSAVLLGMATRYPWSSGHLDSPHCGLWCTANVMARCLARQGAANSAPTRQVVTPGI